MLEQNTSFLKENVQRQQAGGSRSSQDPGMRPRSARISAPARLFAWVLLDSAGGREGDKERQKGEEEEGRQR